MDDGIAAQSDCLLQLLLVLMLLSGVIRETDSGAKTPSQARTSSI